jgi:hypothetical protein
MSFLLCPGVAGAILPPQNSPEEMAGNLSYRYRNHYPDTAKNGV